MKRLSLVLMVLGILGVGVTLGAQSRGFLWSGYYADWTTPTAPCDLSGSAEPVVYTDAFFLVYTCMDGRVIVRQFFAAYNGIDQPTLTHQR